VSEVKTVTLCERDTTCCRIPHVVRLRMRERRGMKPREIVV
jgi:hypothetical protein